MFLSYYLFSEQTSFIRKSFFCHSHYILWVVYRCISKEKSYFQKFGKHEFGKKNCGMLGKKNCGMLGKKNW